MRKVILALILVVLLAGGAEALNRMYSATGLTGSGAALDGINGSDEDTPLAAGDGAMVVVGDTVYFFQLKDTGAPEASPTVIAPDNTGTCTGCRWHLVSVYSAGLKIDDASENYCSIASGSLSANLSWTLPTAYPTGDNHYLQFATSGSGTMSIAQPSAAHLTGVLDSVDRLPALAENYVWQGNASSRPAASNSINVSQVNITGAISGKVYMKAITGSCTVGTNCDSTSTQVLYGGIMEASGAGTTITLPAKVQGMSFCVNVIDSVQVHIDTNASDAIIYTDGDDFDNGHKASSPASGLGCQLCLVGSTVANKWRAISNICTWTDGG